TYQSRDNPTNGRHDYLRWRPRDLPGPLFSGWSDPDGLHQGRCRACGQLGTAGAPSRVWSERLQTGKDRVQDVLPSQIPRGPAPLEGTVDEHVRHDHSDLFEGKAHLGGQVSDGTRSACMGEDGFAFRA